MGEFGTTGGCVSSEIVSSFNMKAREPKQLVLRCSIIQDLLCRSLFHHLAFKSSLEVGGLPIRKMRHESRSSPNFFALLFLGDRGVQSHQWHDLPFITAILANLEIANRSLMGAARTRSLQHWETQSKGRKVNRISTGTVRQRRIVLTATTFVGWKLAL